MDSIGRFLASARRRYAVVALTGALVLLASCKTARAQSVLLDVIEAHYVSTTQREDGNQAPRVVEEGTYVIAPDGRYRIDRVNDGERTAEIMIFAENARIALNYEMERAVIGPMNLRWSAPSARGPRLVPGGAGGPRGISKETSELSLGKKAVGSLLLEGTRYEHVLTGSGETHVFELWVHHFLDPDLLPIIVEQRIETSTSVDERRLTGSWRTQVPRDVFEIPVDFSTSTVRR